MGYKRNFVAFSTGGRVQLKIFLEEHRKKMELKRLLEKKQERRKKYPLSPIEEEPPVISPKPLENTQATHSADVH